MPTKPLPAEDLAHILAHAREPFLSLKNANLFLTGCTGFFGHWLLESLLYANRELALNLHATILTRNAAAFREKSPHLAHDPAFTLLEGDVRTFPFPSVPHTHILHAATDSGGSQTARTTADLHTDILDGTRRVLAFAQQTGAQRLLYTSTGAVYGRSTTLLHTPETFLETHTPALPPDSYEDAKRRSELLLLDAPTPLQPVIARCFAFVGPHLPLDAHFAIGNFIGSALANQPIHIKGDGTPRRSWLYMADLAIWLWTMLLRGQPGRAYNVGSDDGHTIAAAAHLVQNIVRSPKPQSIVVPSKSDHPKNKNCHPEPKAKDLLLARPAIELHGVPDPASPLNSYVPSIDRARDELGLTVQIPLPEAILRTADWHHANR